MLLKLGKQNKNRLNFFFFELRRRCLKHMFYNYFTRFIVSSGVPGYYYGNSLYFLMQFPQKLVYTKYNQYTNYCLVSYRARSVYRKFELTRHQVKNLGSFGLLYGLTKSSW